MVIFLELATLFTRDISIFNAGRSQVNRTMGTTGRISCSRARQGLNALCWTWMGAAMAPIGRTTTSPGLTRVSELGTGAHVLCEFLGARLVLRPVRINELGSIVCATCSYVRIRRTLYCRLELNISDDDSRIVMMMHIHCICIIDDANTLCLHHDSVSMTVVEILIAYYCLLLLVITTYG